MKLLSLLFFSVFCASICGQSLNAPLSNAVIDQSDKFTQKDIFQSAFFLKNDNIVLGKKGATIKYFTNHDHVAAFLAENGIIYHLTDLIRDKEDREKDLKKSGTTIEEEVHPIMENFISMKWTGANPHPEIIASEKGSAYYTFLLREQGSLKSPITSGYKRITYKDVYTGIDIEFYFPENGGIKYNLILHSNADLSQVKLTYKGKIKYIKKDKDGNVVIHTIGGDIIEHAPICYTQTGKTIKSHFVVSNHTLTFKLDEEYDHTETLVIDPWVKVLTSMPPVNMGFNVDYDKLGNLFIYGTAGQYNDTSHFLNVAKYDTNGNPLWIFVGSLPSINWSSGYHFNFLPSANLPSNFYVDKFSGKTYIGQGASDIAAQAIRISDSGIYDTFLTQQSDHIINLREIWDFAYDCNGSPTDANSGRLAILGGNIW